MAKDESLYEDYGPRKELVRVIKEHISKERLEQALQLSIKKRPDAIGHIVLDAIKASPMVSFSGVPHVYSQKYGKYLRFDFHEFKTAIDDAMRKSGVPDGNYSRIGKLVGDAWSEVLCRKYMTDSSVVIMGNGVFDTMDMQLHGYNERYMTNLSVDYDYNPNETPVMWKSFLSRVLPDLQLQQMLQEFLAATFVDRRFAKIEHMLTLLGSGSNGKSVVFEVVLELLGTDNVSTFSIRDLIGSTHSQQNVASCNGKRLNYCSEMRTTHIGENNADAFKSLVSGEPMMARSLYSEPFKASNIPLIMTNANKMPRLDDASFSLQRRMLILPFDELIPECEQDKELATKLKTELSGIFNWVMEGLCRLRDNKYQITIPDVVKELVARYFVDSNPLTRWLDDRRFFCRYTKNTEAVPCWAKLSSLYRNFTQWCLDNGEPQITNRKFSDDMENLGFVRSRRSDGNGFTYYHAPSREDVINANMDLAISMQSNMYLEYVKSKVKEGSRPKVTGADELEKYLGIPSGVIMNYLSSGSLEGSYSRVGNGQLVFDVVSVQEALSRLNFYVKLKEGEESVRKSSAKGIRSIRKTFNAYMKMMGLPIRKIGDSAVISKKNAGCIIVPDDWVYSKESAEELMRSNYVAKEQT